MEFVNISVARKRLSKLVDLAAIGQDVTICRNGKPVARLTSVDIPARQIQFGVLKGKARIVRGFDAPLPETVMAGFENL